ncbi:PQQ-dependent sugar dehydrogenase [Nonomuraea helvata]|uniref:PQQ-dependent sugar dehydrogenase n=1 Tax=Nonomuraea helvata TaxID=37484 RepID=A0ABV5S3E2_9ACTN
MLHARPHAAQFDGIDPVEHLDRLVGGVAGRDLDAGDRTVAQDMNVLAGKIVRMTPEGRVFSDNSFPASLVYSSGHRNPQGLAWDELNVIRPGGNYGWPEVEGIANRNGFTDQQWPPAEASPSGMDITNGSIYSADLRGRHLRQIPLD